MQIGDMVGHKHVDGLGVVLQTPEQTNNGDYLVHFVNKKHPGYYRESFLELVRSYKKV